MCDTRWVRGGEGEMPGFCWRLIKVVILHVPFFNIGGAFNLILHWIWFR